MKLIKYFFSYFIFILKNINFLQNACLTHFLCAWKVFRHFEKNICKINTRSLKFLVSILSHIYDIETAMEKKLQTQLVGHIMVLVGPDAAQDWLILDTSVQKGPIGNFMLYITKIADQTRPCLTNLASPTLTLLRATFLGS